MAFFMTSWWVVIAILVILLIVRYSSRDRSLRNNFDRIISFIAVFQLLILLLALSTKDPIFESIGLPKEYEWIGGLFVSSFLLWQFYLSPLKERVIETEKNVIEIKVDVKNIKEGVERIDSKIK